MTVCAIGYSGIIFGVIMLSVFIGENRYFYPFRLIKIKKIYMPWILLVITQFLIPEASFMGHLCGILAALIIKFCGLFIILPKFEWLNEFDYFYGSKLE